MPTEPDATPVAPEPATESSSAGPAATAVPERRPAPRRLLVLGAFLLAVAVLGLDQLTKWWALNELTIGAPQRQVIGDFLTLRLVLNPGAAFGIGYGYTWVLTIIVVAVCTVIIAVMSRIRSRAWAVTLGMLLGGAVGNLADRLFREPGFGHGHVVDFIGYHNWFTGNVADIAIVAAAVMLALLSILGIGLDGTRDSSTKKVKAEAAAHDVPAKNPGEEAGA